MLEHHPLVKDFPEHKETIHVLKESDNHFCKLFDEYEELDKKTFRVEANQEPISDTDLVNLKKQRSILKDKLYDQILLEEQKSKV